MQGPDPLPDDDHSAPPPGTAPAGTQAESVAAPASRAKVLHDIRGQLSPAMLAADRLSLHADPKVRELADQIIRSIEQAAQRLKDLPGS